MTDIHCCEDINDDATCLITMDVIQHSLGIDYA